MISQKVNDLERMFEIRSAAFDKRNPNPNKDYGIHGVEICWYVKGPKGVIQFLVMTNWMLPHVQEEFKQRAKTEKLHPCLFSPLPADLGYHSYKPKYEGQTMGQEECDYLGGQPCYYDGNGLGAMSLFDKMVAGGEEVLWKELEDYYRSVFDRE